MKAVYFTFIFLFSVIQANSQISFEEGSWDEILELAKTENKPVFVDAYAVWCGPCKRMASEVFTQAGVGDFFNENFINAKIDMEKGEGPGIRSKYGVTAYPTLLFLSPEGVLLHKAVGYQDADRLINNGDMALRKTNEAKEYGQKYEAGERDPQFVWEYMKQLNKAEQSTEKIALEYLQEQKNINPDMKAKIAFEALKNMDSQLLQYVLAGKETIRSNYEQNVIDKKLIDASQSTINTAIQFKAPSVFDQMVESLKQMDMSPTTLSSIERTYFAKANDDEAFLSSIKASLEEENSDPCALAMEIYQSFPDSKPMMQYAREIFDQSFPLNLTMDNYVTGLSLAIGTQDFVYMEQLYGTMQMKANPSAQEMAQVEGLYQKAKSFLNRKVAQN